MSSQRIYRARVSHDIAVALLGLLTFFAFAIHHQRSLRSGVKLLQNAVQTTEFHTAFEAISTTSMQNVLALVLYAAVLLPICISLHTAK